MLNKLPKKFLQKISKKKKAALIVKGIHHVEPQKFSIQIHTNCNETIQAIHKTFAEKTIEKLK